MSYILDALRKADRERSLGEVPDLEAAHWGVRRDGGPRRWLWIVAVLLIFNAALLVWTLGRKHGDDTAYDQAVEHEQAQPVSPPALGVPPVAVSGESSPDEMPEFAQPAPLVPDETDEPGAAPAGALAVRRPKVSVRPHAAPPVEARPEAGATAQPRVVQARIPLTDTADTATPGLPELGELPLEFRSGFQAPRIDVYVYAEQPQRRFILVDLQKYREGDTLQNGAVLEKINPDSIQLFYQGRRFRIDR